MKNMVEESSVGGNTRGQHGWNSRHGTVVGIRSQR